MNTIPPPDAVPAAVDELAGLRAEVADLRAQVAELRAASSRDTADRPLREPSSRREVLRRFGLAAGASAVGAVAISGRAAATVIPVDPGQQSASPTDALIVGHLNQTTQTTELKLPAGGNPVYSHVFVANDGAWSTDRAPYTELRDNGTKAAVAGFAGPVAMNGGYFQTNADQPGSAGVRGVGIKGNAYGVWASGRRAALRLERLPLSDPPTARVDAHLEGEVYSDDNSDLWYCVQGGTPGIWLKLAGPTTAGQFHPITPARVYDSRYTAAVDAGATPLQPGTNRTISVANAFVPNSPALSVSNLVPSGATAIAYNLTVAGTGPQGYLSLKPGGVLDAAAASINWFMPGTVLGNASVVKLDDQRQVTVFCFGSSTDMILDVVGYYR